MADDSRARDSQTPRGTIIGDAPPANDEANPNAPLDGDFGAAAAATTAVNLVPAQRNRFGLIRDRLFHTMLVRMALNYNQLVSYGGRRLIEFLVLVMAMCLLTFLIYVHVVFNRLPGTCLSAIHDSWPRKGILRVEVLHNLERIRQSQMQFSGEHSRETFCEFDLRKILVGGPAALPSELRRYVDHMNIDVLNAAFGALGNGSTTKTLSSSSSPAVGSASYLDQNELITPDSFVFSDLLIFKIVKQLFLTFYAPFHWENSDYEDENADQPANDSSKNSGPSDNKEEKLSSDEKAAATLSYDDEEADEYVSDFNSIPVYVIEYSLHYGLLKLTPAMRQEYAVPVMIVQLDADASECFGDWRNRFLMHHVVGFEEVVMLSLRWLAENETEKGFMRDLITGDHYHFVVADGSRHTYAVAMFVMLVFTFAISMLLRFSHHQIFVFIIDLMQMFEQNQPFVFPIAPLLTVILALVGMEAIMSEVFNNTSTAFYVILLVWIADQYDAICCQSSIGKRHWLKFFYLYHYAFYAYHYRYNGQYGDLALLTSAVFILHSMIFFFHHYEIPLIIYQEQLRQVVNDLQHNTISESATLDVSISLTAERQSATQTTRNGIGVIAIGDDANSAASSATSTAANAAVDSNNVANNDDDGNFVVCTIRHFLRRHFDGRRSIVQRIPLRNDSQPQQPLSSTHPAT